TRTTHATTLTQPHNLTTLLQPPTHTLSTLFFFNTPATTQIYTLSLHDALPISTTETRGHNALASGGNGASAKVDCTASAAGFARSEEHTSELQSRENLVCRLLLEKKKKKKMQRNVQKLQHPTMQMAL